MKDREGSSPSSRFSYVFTKVECLMVLRMIYVKLNLCVVIIVILYADFDVEL